jgi:hypothetical protein
MWEVEEVMCDRDDVMCDGYDVMCDGEDVSSVKWGLNGRSGTQTHAMDPGPDALAIRLGGQGSSVDTVLQQGHFTTSYTDLKMPPLRKITS